MDDSAIKRMVKANDVTVVADKNHTDPAIFDHLRAQLPSLSAQGLRHIYLEQDAKDIGVSELAAADTPLGRLTAEAIKQGVTVHLFDDRSEKRALKAKYPQAAAYADANDYYLFDPEALIANAPNADEMRAYIAGREQTSGSLARNEAIIRNIDAGLNAAAGEKAMVVIGAWHVEQHDDIDEGLRRSGHQVGVIEIKSDNTRVVNRGPDVPDIVARTETGLAISYKPSPEARGGVRIQSTPMDELPWRNTEAVIPAIDPMKMSLQGVDLNGLRGCSTDGHHYCNGETGALAALVTHDKSKDGALQK